MPRKARTLNINRWPTLGPIGSWTNGATTGNALRLTNVRISGFDGWQYTTTPALVTFTTGA